MAYLLPFATLNNDTVIGYVSTLDSLSDRVRFPTFARVSNTQTSMGRAVLAFLQKFNWTTIALVSSSACAVTMDAITNTITGNISIVYQYVFSSPFPSYNETLKVLSQLQTSARSKSK